MLNLIVISLILCIGLNSASYNNISKPHTCLYDTDYFQTHPQINSQKYDFTKLYQQVPIFLNTSIVGNKCRKGIEKYMNALENGQIWALKLFDASAKIPSGILRGNINQYGDFTECLELSEAQYCLVELNVQNFWLNNPHLSTQLEHLIHANYLIKGNFSDPAHRVPNFSTIKWGICVPKECNYLDIQKSLEINNAIKAQIRPELCQRSMDEYVLSFGDVFTRLLFLFLLMAFIISSILVYFNISNESVLFKILLSFAIQNNWKIRKDDAFAIKGVHGVRAMSALALLMSHKAVAQMFGPYTNMTVKSEHLGQSWSVIGRTAVIYTDSFILLSGLLAANSMIGSLCKTGQLGFFQKLVQRIFRISPTFIIVILFSTYILPLMGTGPLWPIVINHHATLCKQYMWRNIFFIHNYFGFDKMCLTHTHQIGIDMQLFLISPILIKIIWKNRKIGYALAAFIVLLSNGLRFYISYIHELSHVVHYGITISRMFDTASLSYILPTHRISIYIFGICLAFILHDKSLQQLAKHKNSTNIYSIIGIGSGVIAGFGPYAMAMKFYKYNALESAFFGTFMSLFWGLAVCYTLHAANFEYGGLFPKFLCWSGFQYFTKISYSFYLVQFPLFFYNVGLTKTSIEYNPLSLLDPTETFLIIIVAILLTFFIEMPFLNVYKILFVKPVCKVHK